MGIDNWDNKEQPDQLPYELRAAADRLSDLVRLLDRCWPDPLAEPIRKKIMRHIYTLDALSRILGSPGDDRPFSGVETAGEAEGVLPAAENAAAHCWDENGMRLFRDDLTESRAQIRRILAQYEEAEDQTPTRYARADGEAIRRVLRDTVQTESAVIDSIPVLDKIYKANENAIADYFDLAVQKFPPTRLGTSTFVQLDGHEAQMPFAQRM